MVKKEDIDRFYSDVQALGLKFPVAAISKATGAYKGNVSQILRKKLEPSESFLNKFYEAFKESFNNVPHENNHEALDSLKDQKIIDLLERENTRLRRDHEISLKKMEDDILLNRAMGVVIRDMLFEILARQRKSTIELIAEEKNRQLGELIKKAPIGSSWF